MNPPDQPSPATEAWMTGLPDVSKGKQRSFLCATRGTVDGKIYVRQLDYLNAHVMPCGEGLEPSSNAVLVDEDADEYAWTGWFEDSCDQCETSWAFSGDVEAWMELPSYDPARHHATRPGAAPDVAALDDKAAKERAEWLHKHNAPWNWIVLTTDEVAALKAQSAALAAERDAAVRQIEIMDDVSTKEIERLRTALTTAREREARLVEALRTIGIKSHVCTWPEPATRAPDDTFYTNKQLVDQINHIAWDALTPPDAGTEKGAT